MATEVLVTSEEFKKLKNPYTGLPMRVVMVVGSGSDPLFHAAKEEYSPSQEQESPKRCYDLWNRVDGVGGMKDRQLIRCAYTGEPLSLVHTETGCRYDGGFNPHMLYSREEFLYRASMRGGVSKYPKPGERDRVEYVRRVDIPASRKNKDRGGDVSGEAIDLAAASMQQHKDVFDQGPTTVRISRQGGKSRK